MIRYRERVPSSRLLRIGGALTVALLFWWYLVNGVAMVSGVSARLIPSIVFIIGFTILGYGIISLFDGVRIRTSRVWMMDGTRQEVLKIRGVRKGDRLDIPFRDIRKVCIVSYEARSPFWQALARLPNSTDSDSNRLVVALPGYQGTGLAVTYLRENLFSSGNQEITAIFPTRKPERIQEILPVSCDDPDEPDFTEPPENNGVAVRLAGK